MKNILSVILFICISYNLSAQYVQSDSINFDNIKESDKAKLIKYFKPLDNFRQRGDLKSLTKHLNFIANIYWKSDNYPQAIKYFDQSIEENKKIKNDHGIAGIENWKGMIYADSKQYKKSVESFEKALEYYKLRRQRKDIISTYVNMSLSYKNMPNMKKAIESAEGAFQNAQELNDVQKIVDCAGLLSSYYKEAKNEEKAEFYFNIYKAFVDSKEKEMKNTLQMLKVKNALNESKQQAQKLELYKSSQNMMMKDKLIIEKDSTYRKLSKKYKDEQIISKLYEETITQNEIIISKERRILRIIVISLIITILLLIMAIYFYFKYRKYSNKLVESNEELNKSNIKLNEQKEEILVQKEEILVQKEEIEAQRDELEDQKNYVVQQNTQIKDSIHYARRIQTAVLDNEEVLREWFDDSFILSMPRDIVSGDFYWLGKLNNKKIVAVADCTGHGVPGAFMSMLGSLFLNDIVNKEHVDKPSEILNRLRNRIKQSLKQTGKFDETKDGMDIALVSIDYENMKLEFAGAYNPLVIYRNNDVEVIKGDRMPIGIHIVETDFSNHEVKIHKNDKLYLFSDGYYDQMGGKEGRKFLFVRFLEMIKGNAEKDMNSQKQQYKQVMKEWMSYQFYDFGNASGQIDDIMFMGIKI